MGVIKMVEKLKGIKFNEKCWLIPLDDDELTLYFYNDKTKAMRELKTLIKDNPDAEVSIAELTYSISGDKGKFSATGVDLKEIMKAWAMEEDE